MPLSMKMNLQPWFSELKVFDSQILKIIAEIHWNEEARAYSDVDVVDGTKTFITHKGYISLFPFLMGFIAKNDSKLLVID
jgi:hypothetical protein